MLKNKKLLLIACLVFVGGLVLLYNYFYNIHFNSQIEKYFGSGGGESIYVYNGEFTKLIGTEEEYSLTNFYEIYLQPGDNYKGSFVVRNNLGFDATVNTSISLLNSDDEKVELINLDILDIDDSKFILDGDIAFYTFEISVPSDFEIGDFYSFLISFIIPKNPNIEVEKDYFIEIATAIGMDLKLEVVEDPSLYEYVNMYDHLKVYSKQEVLNDSRIFVSAFFGIISLVLLFVFFYKK